MPNKKILARAAWRRWQLLVRSCARGDMMLVAITSTHAKQLRPLRVGIPPGQRLDGAGEEQAAWPSHKFDSLRLARIRALERREYTRTGEPRHRTEKSRMQEREGSRRCIIVARSTATMRRDGEDVLEHRESSRDDTHVKVGKRNADHQLGHAVQEQAVRVRCSNLRSGRGSAYRSVI